MIKCASIRLFLYFFSTLMGHYDQGEVKKRCLETWKVRFFFILYSYTNANVSKSTVVNKNI